MNKSGQFNQKESKTRTLEDSASNQVICVQKFKIKCQRFYQFNYKRSERNSLYRSYTIFWSTTFIALLSVRNIGPGKSERSGKNILLKENVFSCELENLFRSTNITCYLLGKYIRVTRTNINNTFFDSINKNPCQCTLKAVTARRR